MVHKIQYPWAKPVFLGKEQEYVKDALASTWISGGTYVDRFERAFGKLIKASEVITTSNGTTALYLAMLGLGIGPGDEVIVPGFTFVAAANMVIAAGAKPIFVDVDRDTWCINPACVVKAITKKTKAVCAVHLYGNVCDMKALQALCKKHKLFLIEDAAQAAFSSYQGQYAGTLSDVGTFSFQATKTIAMGEGGCVVTKDKDLYARMKIIRNHGMNRERFYWHTAIGHNFRLSNVLAAIGCAQLELYRNIVARKKKVYQLYLSHLHNIPGVNLQQFRKEVDPLVWAVAVRIDPNLFGMSRDQLMMELLKAGIEMRPGFYPAEVLPVYKKFLRQALPVAAELGVNILSFPSFPQLEARQIAWICSRFKALKK